MSLFLLHRHGKNVNTDAWRLNQLWRAASNPEHPYSYFHTGNLDTLITVPTAKGISAHQAVRDFANTMWEIAWCDRPERSLTQYWRCMDMHLALYIRACLSFNFTLRQAAVASAERLTLKICQGCRYSANLMRLVVYGRDSVADLARIVQAKFGPIIDKKLEPPSFSGQYGRQTLKIRNSQQTWHLSPFGTLSGLFSVQSCKGKDTLDALSHNASVAVHADWTQSVYLHWDLQISKLVITPFRPLEVRKNGCKAMPSWIWTDREDAPFEFSLPEVMLPVQMMWFCQISWNAWLR